MSRDDYGQLHQLLSRSRTSCRNDPFQTIDRDGVGGLMKIARRKGPQRRAPKLKLGICGEHGGDPASVMFCDEIGLDYVSCSPFRVPIARLAAAQAAVAAAKAPKAGGKKKSSGKKKETAKAGHRRRRYSSDRMLSPPVATGWLFVSLASAKHPTASKLHLPCCRRGNVTFQPRLANYAQA